MKEHWAASTGLIASLLRWLLVPRLRFELFDHSWWCDQNRGTQQGGSHSPTLFGRIFAARFEQLTNHWWSKGERPVFVADALSLWALWFIDDAILLFRSVAQTLRLLPQVVSMLADRGLTINVSKSRFLCCQVVWLRTDWSPPLSTWVCPLEFPMTKMKESLISCVAVPRLPSSPIVLFLSTVGLPVCNGCVFSRPSSRLRFGGLFVSCPSSKVFFSVFVFTVSPC